jgi:hypothetical protein
MAQVSVMDWRPNKCVHIDFGVLGTNAVHAIKYHGKESRMRLLFLALISRLFFFFTVTYLSFISLTNATRARIPSH